MSRLTALDMDARLKKAEYAERLAAAQHRFLELRLQLGGQTNGGNIGPGLLVVMEGSDAGGKGGAIKRMVEPLDPRHYSVITYAAPTEREKRHHFLWRFWSAVPGKGGMCVFDRSWYGRILVERVEGFATPAEWTRAFDEIVQFERGLVQEGVILVKFWLAVSPDVQLERFRAREGDPPQELEADRRGLAEPGEAGGLRRRRRGHVRAHRPRPRPVEPHRRRPEALGADRGPRDPDPPDRGGSGAS